jgi:CRISPR/Cas system CSM-associated protein Csm2 small subunit
MFHEVKIFDKRGKVKKILSSNNLSTEYWNSFFNNSLNDAMQKGKDREKKFKKNANCNDENLR